MFSDRRDAGKKLMDLVKQYRHEIDLVLAIPKGGVEVAWEIAQELGVPLKLISARKIGAPGNPEIAIGAVAPDGSTWFSHQLTSYYDLTPQEVQDLSSAAAAQLDRERSAYGNEVNLTDVKGKGVLIVDDGAATGATIMASVEALRKAGARPIGAAVPVASIDVVSIMEDSTDFFLALETPSDFLAVSQYYQDFRAVSDHTVQQVLTRQP